MTRAKRPKLIVNNTRFLVLDETREPNLASQSLGAALRALPAQWQDAHGFLPLLAESFTDMMSLPPCPTTAPATACAIHGAAC